MREISNSYEKLGSMSGLAYTILMSISIPALIFSDPSFSNSIHEFDPLSHLSTSEYFGFYYRIVLILGGIFALLYFQLYFIPSRKNYKALKNWKLASNFGRLGALGQIGVGIFDESYFPMHLIVTIIVATGYVSCLMLVSLNLDDQLKEKRDFTLIINSGYIISILALLNAFYFRYSNIRGIWQFFVLIMVIFWYLIERIIYSRNNIKISSPNEIIRTDINKISYLMLFFGIYIIIFAYLLYTYPKMEPWSCNENDQRCATPNIVSLLIAGTILIAFTLNYQIRILKNRNKIA